MPGLDKTGPLGQGSQTGRKTGLCNPDAETQAGAFFPRRWFAARRARGSNMKMTGDGRGPGRGLGRFWGGKRGRQA